MASAASLLAQIDTAIEALLTGQHTSYSIGGRSVSRIPLKELYEIRKDLQLQVERESSGAFRLAKLQKTSTG